MSESETGRLPKEPTVFLALEYEPTAVAVLRALQERILAVDFAASLGDPSLPPPQFHVVAGCQEVRALFQGGLSPWSTVVLFEADLYRKRFASTCISRPDGDIPCWACGAQWGVKLNHCELGQTPRNAGLDVIERQKGCARQIAADFRRNFRSRLARGHFPWGTPRRDESLPLLRYPAG